MYCTVIDTLYKEADPGTVRYGSSSHPLLISENKGCPWRRSQLRVRRRVAALLDWQVLAAGTKPLGKPGMSGVHFWPALFSRLLHIAAGAWIVLVLPTSPLERLPWRWSPE